MTTNPTTPLLALLALASLAAAAGADTLKVPTAAYPTIAAAVAAAQPGDTIQIAPNNAPGSGGVYTETLTITNAKNGLRFVASGKVVWDGGNVDTLSFVGGYQNAHVEGFTFRNGQMQVKVFGDHATVKDCEFVGSLVNGSIRISGTFATVSNVTIRSAQHRGIFIQGTDATITKAKIEQITGPGIQLFQADRAVVSQCSIARCRSAIEVDPGDDVQILNNTVTDTDFDGLVLHGARAVVQNNKIRGVGGLPGTPQVNCGIRGIGASPQAMIASNTIEATAGYGIHIDGIQATIAKNKLTNVGGGISVSNGSSGAADGPLISGNTIKSSVGAADAIAAVADNGAQILNNTVEVSGGRGIGMVGAAAVIRGNKLSHVRGGIQVDSGSTALLGGPVVAENKIQSVLTGHAILVLADQFQIHHNSIARVLTFSQGIFVEPLGLGAANGQIQANKVAAACGFGIKVEVGHTAIADNVVDACGSGFYGTGGIKIAADGCSITNNKVTGAAGDGYAIEGSANFLIGCVASGCFDDGFDVRSGANNSLNDCTATLCLAEGFDNSSGVTGTSVQNCVFTKCRIDFAGNGTLVVDTNNTFKSGGPSQAPVIDQQ